MQDIQPCFAVLTASQRGVHSQLHVLQAIFARRSNALSLGSMHALPCTETCTHAILLSWAISGSCCQLHILNQSMGACLST